MDCYLPLSLLDYRFCQALLADIGNCSHESSGARGIPRGVSGHTSMFSRTVGQSQAMLKIETLAVTRCSIEMLTQQIAVLRMNPRQDKFHSWSGLWVTLKNSETP